jgi:predicted transcriptional regulator
MNVLWDKGPANVHEYCRLSRQSRISHNSVLTIIRILETKGYVKHVKQACSHLYAQNRPGGRDPF